MFANNGVDSDNIEEDYVVKPCPLCKADVRFHLISLTEKVLWCDNIDCTYPFGHEDFQVSPVEYKTELNLDKVKSTFAWFKKIGSFPVTLFPALLDKNKLKKVCSDEVRKTKLVNCLKEIKELEEDGKIIMMQIDEMGVDIDENNLIKIKTKLDQLMKMHEMAKKGRNGVALAEKLAFTGGRL